MSEHINKTRFKEAEHEDLKFWTIVVNRYVINLKSYTSNICVRKTARVFLVRGKA